MDVPAVERCWTGSLSVGVTRTFLDVDDLAWYPCSSCVSVEWNGSVGSLTGTSVDPECVTVEGVMYARAGSVTPGVCEVWA